MKQIVIILIGLMIVGCSTSQGVSRSADGDVVQNERKSRDYNAVDVDAAESGIDLTSYLRRVPGLQIRGNGESATIRVRGNVSIEGESRPLFVVDGTPIGYEYSSLYSLVDPNEIDRIRVLKTPSETSRYGVQGSNGVIEVKMRGR